MKTMAISKFKAHALKVLDEVAKTKETIIITKRGKPLAQVMPHCQSETKPKPGRLADAFVFENDIITPLGENLWETTQ
jgi:prevent-host-death family protein